MTPTERTQAAIDQMQAAIATVHHLDLLKDIAVLLGAAQRELPGDTSKANDLIEEALELIAEAFDGPEGGTDA